MVFKTEKQLENFLLNKCKNAVSKTEKKVHRVINNCLKQFYSEFSPEEYIRTGQLLHSLVRSGVKATGGGFEAEVYFDVSLLGYQKGVVPTQHGTGFATWDGGTVLGVAMESGVPHGGYAGGTAIWTVSNQILGDILELLERELIAQGIPIVK